VPARIGRCDRRSLRPYRFCAIAGAARPGNSGDLRQVIQNDTSIQTGGCAVARTSPEFDDDARAFGRFDDLRTELDGGKSAVVNQSQLFDEDGESEHRVPGAPYLDGSAVLRDGFGHVGLDLRVDVADLNKLTTLVAETLDWRDLILRFACILPLFHRRFVVPELVYELGGFAGLLHADVRLDVEVGPFFCKGGGGFVLEPAAASELGEELGIRFPGEGRLRLRRLVGGGVQLFFERFNAFVPVVAVVVPELFVGRV